MNLATYDVIRKLRYIKGKSFEDISKEVAVSATEIEDKLYGRGMTRYMSERTEELIKEFRAEGKTDEELWDLIKIAPTRFRKHY